MPLDKRIEILDGMHAEVGKKMIEWVLHPETRPTTVAQLKSALDGLATIDEQKIKAVQFIDTNPSVALFRLPPKDMVQASVDRAEDPAFNIADYKLPGYYQVTNPSALGLTAIDLFRSRIGDYTTGECE